VRNKKPKEETKRREKFDELKHLSNQKKKEKKVMESEIKNKKR